MFVFELKLDEGRTLSVPCDVREARRREEGSDFIVSLCDFYFLFFCLEHITCSSINSSRGSQCVFDVTKEGFLAFNGNAHSDSLTCSPALMVI